MVGEGVVNLARKAENVMDKENYIDFRLRLLGEPGKAIISQGLFRQQFKCRDKTWSGTSSEVHP